MYKNYEDKLNTILSNAKGEKIEKVELNRIDDLEKLYDRVSRKAIPLKKQAIKIGNELIDVNIELLSVATRAKELLKQAKDLGANTLVARLNTVAENAKDVAKGYNKLGSEILGAGRQI